ncbi:MAG TPA: hypothetical protein VNH42_01800, partial [Mariprofundaceae bacterium]|nr:hypothetical protein [Mariprofundaceae bacterium]
EARLRREDIRADGQMPHDAWLQAIEQEGHITPDERKLLDDFREAALQVIRVDDFAPEKAVAKSAAKKSTPKAAPKRRTTARR